MQKLTNADGFFLDFSREKLLLVGRKEFTPFRTKRILRVRSVSAKREKGFLVSACASWPEDTSALNVEQFKVLEYEQLSGRVVRVEK
jgi:hypothetical protein